MTQTNLPPWQYLQIDLPGWRLQRQKSSICFIYPGVEINKNIFLKSIVQIEKVDKLKLFSVAILCVFKSSHPIYERGQPSNLNQDAESRCLVETSVSLCETSKSFTSEQVGEGKISGIFDNYLY